MDLKNKKVFVTGAGGFIGSHLCSKLLDQGADVTAMLHYNSRSDWCNLEFLDQEKKDSLRVIKGNIEDSSFMDLNTKNHDVVFHLAALIGIPYSYEAPLSYVKTNIQGTVNVLEAARKNNIELIINTSTSETYGTAIYSPIDESHPMQGQSPYSATKISADMLAESYYNSFETPVITVRPFNTYGPRQSARAVIPTIISQLLSKDKIILGGLSPIRDFTYVDDIVSGIIGVISKPPKSNKKFDHYNPDISSSSAPYRILNIGNSNPVNLMTYISLIEKNLGKKAKINFMPLQRGDVEETFSDISKISALTNYNPKVDVETGVKNFIDWYKSYYGVNL